MRGIDDLITPDSFRLHNKELEIIGHRVALLIDPNSGNSTFGTVNKVQVQLELPPGVADTAGVSAALDKVFVDEPERRNRDCNEEEKAEFHKFVSEIREKVGTISATPNQTGSPAAMMCMLDGSRGYRYGAGIIMPKVVSAPDPSYPEALRRQRVQPTVHFIIRVDENGSVTDIVALAEPSLAGAFASGFVLRKWKFKPAMLEQGPVPAILTVEIGFRLY